MEKIFTLCIIKPDAVKRNITGKINDLIERDGFQIIAQRVCLLSLQQSQDFYSVHKDRFFFQDLCAYMSSGMIFAQVLKKEHAVENFRTLIGHTDPKQAGPQTIRGSFGLSIDHNSVHGSDAWETAEKEIAFFFARMDLFI